MSTRLYILLIFSEMVVRRPSCDRSTPPLEISELSLNIARSRCIFGPCEVHHHHHHRKLHLRFSFYTPGVKTRHQGSRTPSGNRLIRKLTVFIKAVLHLLYHYHPTFPRSPPDFPHKKIRCKFRRSLRAFVFARIFSFTFLPVASPSALVGMCVLCFMCFTCF